MPSIEIISLESVNSDFLLKDYNFAIQFEKDKIESHRSLFYDFLKDLNGTIIHLGNHDFKINNNGFFAGALIDWNIELKNDFKFLPEFESDFKKLLKLVQEYSLVNTIYFLSDYQFSKRKPKIIDNTTLEHFINNYDKNGIEFNRLYKITN